MPEDKIYVTFHAAVVCR